MDNKHKYDSHSDRLEAENKRTHRLALIGSGAIAAATLTYGVHQAAQPADISGEQIVRIVPGDTVNGIVKSEVDGGASHTGEVSEWVVNANPAVFEDGTASLGSEDLGQEIIVPESVK